MKTKMIIRAYRLRLYPNAAKAELARYNLWWGRCITLDYVRRFWYLAHNASESTAGLGKQIERWQEHARDVLRGVRATGSNCPADITPVLDATIRPSKDSSFDYWIKPIGLPWIPTKSHAGLNAALTKGGELHKHCEVVQRDGKFFVHVFVAFKVEPSIDTNDYLACDVGVNAGVVRSDGYIGQSLRPILNRARTKAAEQRRQRHIRTSRRTAVKQFLDHEAKRTVTLAARSNKTVVVERLKALANLKPTGSIGGWARQHFGMRVRQIAEISGVAIIEVHPAWTSITGPRCWYSDGKNRRGIRFECVRCGARGHADVVASRNLARKARGDWRIPITKAALQTRSRGQAHACA
jgi:hypothetical protein